MSCSPSKRRELDVTKLLMSDWKVELVEDNLSEFYIEFAGPKESECGCFECARWVGERPAHVWACVWVGRGGGVARQGGVCGDESGAAPPPNAPLVGAGAERETYSSARHRASGRPPRPRSLRWAG